ncbi:hypothetical protein [Clostridium culturomicium]|uniref:hypothetical protein n=1 Tax=Clostridium culturomicium TaxID=1499683 RepID=UPI003857D13E
MLNASDSFKAAMNQPGRTLKAKLVFSDEVFEGDIIQSITLEDSILTSDEFEIGTFITTSGTCNMIRTNYVFSGKEFKLHIGVLNTLGVIEYLDLGFFKVSSVDIKETITSIKFKDRTSKFDEEYVSSIVYPASLLDIAQEVCTKVGVTLATTNFNNANHIVELKPNFDTGTTYRDVIAQIAELAAGYARINTTGALEIFNINKFGTNSVYAGNSTFAENTSDRLVDNRCVIGIDRNTFINCDTSESVTQTITKVIVKVGDVKAELGDSSGATYVIQNNIFCQNPLDLIANLYEKLNGIDYMKLNVKWIGNPIWQPGDQLTVYDGYRLNNTYIMERKLNFNGGLTEEYSASGKTKEEKSNVKGNITLKVENTIVEVKIAKDEIAQRVKKDDFETYVVQTAEEIKSKVSRGDDLKTEVTQNAESWELSIKGKLTGKKYRFDGEGFTIGGDTSDVAKHTPEFSQWKNSNGSVTRIDAEGFYNMNGSTKREYHYLYFSKKITFPKQIEGAGGYTSTIIDLPAEFKGKNINVNISIANMPGNYVPSSWGVIGDVGTLYRILPNNQLEVSGKLYVYDTKNDSWHMQNERLEVIVEVIA